MMNMIFLYNVKVLFNDIFSVCLRDSENEKNCIFFLLLYDMVFKTKEIIFELAKMSIQQYPIL